MLRRVASIALILAAGCSAPESVRAPVSSPAPVATREPVAPIAPDFAREIAIGQLRVRAAAIVKTLRLRTYGNDDETRRRAVEFGLDEELTRKLVATIAAPCLATKDGDSPACAGFDAVGSRSDSAVEALVALLGEIADPRRVTPTTKLLVRLRAVGSTQATSALEQLLDRRMTKSYAACAPPTDAEIAASASSLGDFAIASGNFARAPRSSELADLAYFHAAIVAPGLPIGSFEEDFAGTPLGQRDAGRELLRQEMQEALVTGAIDEHVKFGSLYLESLGFPGRVRVREETERRWGGYGFGFVMRDVAISLELEGRNAEAEALYRRGSTGGGRPWGSIESVRSEQIQGVIRTVEATVGCRAVVVERLFSIAHDLRKSYGTKRLADSGFDVARLYRGALLTLGRHDRAALEQTLKTDPRLAKAALARLERLGAEDFATRTRAIPGLAADAGKASFPDLLAIARRGRLADRIEAIEALGNVAEDHGSDPCVGRFGWSHGTSRMDREVSSVMHDCETKLAKAEADALASDLAELASAPEREVRIAIAEALGRLGRPRSRAVLNNLARDTFTTGGQRCRTDATGEHCNPDRPVRQAAEDALTMLDQADKNRAEDAMPSR